MGKKGQCIAGSTWFKAVIALVISSVLVLLFCGIRSEKGFKQEDSKEAFISYLDEYIPALMADYDVPGLSIALVQGGETVWTNAYGYADVDAGVKMTADTYASVQSISKPVTAWGVMRLAEQGLIDLDAPAGLYLKGWEIPESDYTVSEVTIRRLLSHTAGMPLGNFNNMFSPREDMPSLKETLSDEAVLMQQPGLSFSYSNTGFNLLELLIEEVTGRDFAEYMREEILLPLGIKRATFIWNETLSPPVPFGYNLKGKAVPVYVYPEKGSGGLFADAEAVARFAIAGMPGFSEQRVLRGQSINEMYSAQAVGLGVYSLVFDSYGLGYYLETLPGGETAVSHGGQGAGWMTYFYAVPETGDGIVLLTNSQRSWPLMAYVLRDWADWNELEAVGMEAIITGQTALWAFMGLVWAAALLLLWRLVEGAAKGTRRFSPFAKERLARRLLMGVVSIALTLIVVWCISQDYMFISSVFPRASAWLAGTALVFAAVIMASAIYVKNENTGRPGRTSIKQTERNDNVK